MITPTADAAAGEQRRPRATGTSQRSTGRSVLEDGHGTQSCAAVAVRSLRTCGAAQPGRARLGPCGCSWSRTRCGWRTRCGAGWARTGFAVDVAADGATGLELARHGDYDAVLLDVMLPGLSGYDVVRTLRAEENWVPVLMLSAKDGEHDQADGLDCGADDYLTKPFSYVVLLGPAAGAAAPARRGPARRCSAPGDVRLDPATRRGHRRRRAGVARPRASSPCSSTCCAARAGWSPRSRSSTTSGTAAATVDPNVVEVYVGLPAAQARAGRLVRDGPRRRATASRSASA